MLDLVLFCFEILKKTLCFCLLLLLFLSCKSKQVKKFGKVLVKSFP